MLDRRTPYVQVTTDNRTGDVWGNKENVPPIVAIKAELKEEDGKTYLRFGDVGADHPHMQPGKVIKDLKNGIVFYMERMDWTVTLTALTMEQFEKRMRPYIDPETSDMIHDLDDVYTWIRSKVGMT